MKIFTTGLQVGIFSCVLIFTGIEAWAGEPASIASPVVAVVDVQRILQESLAAKSVQKQIDVQRSKFQAETEKEENALRKAEEDLSKAHDSLSSDAYGEREQQLRQRTLTIERHFESRRKVLDQAFADAKNAISAALLDIVQTAAHERGANIVLLKQQILWANPALDVTDEVLSRLNKKLPQIPIKMGDEDKP